MPFHVVAPDELREACLTMGEAFRTAPVDEPGHGPSEAASIQAFAASSSPTKVSVSRRTSSFSSWA